MTKNTNPLTRFVLIGGLLSMLSIQAGAQTFTTLHGFTSSTNDGANPFCELLMAGNKLYGTTSAGGVSGAGTVFVMKLDGSGYTNLYSFTTGTANSDGNSPQSGLVLSGTNLYGVAIAGGAGAVGTLFAVSTDGSFTNLHNFSGAANSPPYTNTDGAAPNSRLVLSSNILYGTAEFGGTGGNGTIFAFNLDTGAFSNLYSFTALSSSYPSTNNDGANPSGGLILSGNTLYGTTQNGGTMDDGTVFAIQTDGTGFTNLYNFTGGTDGYTPEGGVVLSGNTLYGTTEYGGGLFLNSGTVFAITTNGMNFRTLYEFQNNGDGANPIGGLLVSSNTLYGTTASGGSNYNGNIFGVNTDGSGFTNLYSFTPTDAIMNTNADGIDPQAGLILSGETLYGTAPDGGAANLGTVFSLSLVTITNVPPLAISQSGNMVTVYWQNVPGWNLQQNTNLVVTNGWSNSGGIITTNGTNYLDLTSPSGNLFFRLKGP